METLLIKVCIDQRAVHGKWQDKGTHPSVAKHERTRKGRLLPDDYGAYDRDHLARLDGKAIERGTATAPTTQ